jgi:hypothetical protein
MTTHLHDPDAVRLALRRRFLKFGPSVDEAMVIVGTVLQERDDEIARLTAALEDGGLGEPPPGALL